MHHFSLLTRVTRRAVRLMVALLLIAAFAPTARAADTPPPNFLLILSDDQSAPHVGCYGNPDVHTPNLDRLAADGLRFDRAYVTSPQCVPSRAAILTGRHTIDIGMTRFSAALPRDVKLFPEYLRAHGYYTGLCGRTYHLNGTNLNNPLIRPHLTDDDLPNIPDRLDYVRTAAERGGQQSVRPETFAQFDEFLSKIPPGHPFFLQLCWSDPHRPHTAEDLPYHHNPDTLHLPPDYPDVPSVRHDLAAYYDEIGRMDSDTGKILATLEQHGLAKNTVVIFMGDNGGSQLRGKGTLNELGIRVPLIIRWPGVTKPGTSTSALVSGEDLGPTLLEAAGLTLDTDPSSAPTPAAATPRVARPSTPAEPSPTLMTGISFLPLLRGESQPNPRTSLVAERGPHASGLPRGSASFDLGRVIVTPRYKLIYNALWQLPYQPVDFKIDDLKALHDQGKLDEKFVNLYLAPTRPMFELYDLQTDPHELTNLAGQPASRDLEQRLRGQLAAWMIHHHDFIPLPLAPKKRAEE